MASVEIAWCASASVVAGAIDEAERDLPGVILSAALAQFRLGIEQIDMTWAAVHEERDHRFRVRPERRHLGLQIERDRAARHGGRRGQKIFLPQQPGQGDTADAHGITGQETPARPWLRGKRSVG